jgi:undecaprenyl-phosphate 4-deoxy-4-formamido-L-arabinose transferase
MMRPVPPVATLDRTTETLSVSVVVPVFNSEASIDELCERIVSTMESMPAVDSWELILVNDGSEDASWDRVVALSYEHPEIRGVDLTRNWGQHNALLAGAHAALYDVVVNLDDDLQNAPEEIPKLIEALGPDLDVVYGMPVAVQQAAYRRLGSSAVRATIRTLTRRQAVSLATGFRAFRRELADDLPEASGRHVALDSLLRTLTDRFDAVPVDHQPRRVGRSNYTLARLVRLAVTEVRTDLRRGRNGDDPVPSYAVRAVTEPKLSGDGRH